MTDHGPLEFFNGIGGFNRSAEYEIRLSGSELPPAPWVNVIANSAGGFIVSESGAGPIWATNSSQFRLTPWQNDPVCDRPGDSIYLTDEDTRESWSPTAAPIRENTPYVVRHGAGYSVFEHAHDGIVTSLRMGVPLTEAVKLQVLTITNESKRRRRIAIASYAEWVLGTTREATRFHVRTWQDSGVMFAHNAFDPEFAHLTAFSTITPPVIAHTSSRAAFLGRNGAHSQPQWPGSDVDDPSRDPCAAIKVRIELDPGETRSLSVATGAAGSERVAADLAARYQDPVAAHAAIEESVSAWQSRLETIAVRTPDRSFNLVLNRWAMYQALSCRIWGRIALYQSSGAFGFRDQLQDVMALTYASPEIARDQIIHAASRQFEEGDVQHWWHPHSGRGIRTRFSDDLVWLPYVVDHYVNTTGDRSVLDVETKYLRMRGLEADEEEIYAIPDVSERSASVFGHCVHALDRACTIGAHGLPLIGSGDWNDGMNRVGVDGKGESVWLAWFLIDTCRRFAAHADARGESTIASTLRLRADDYAAAIERTAWDGEWYRRAYYDDGAPLGSHVNSECQIDSIAQSWSVISGAGDPARSEVAMDSLHRRLVSDDARLVMLLTPPFDRGMHDPGYIQGYLPGVRENGAQYTHAALWAVLATALQGDGEKAFELYQMINPITHAATPADVSVYKVEPYVVAADVYTAEGHVGRGGWTWYTGSASWLYRVGLEAILGFRKRGQTLEIDPCIPSRWKEFDLTYRYGNTVYEIFVKNPSGAARGVTTVTVDGVSLGASIDLVEDGKRHAVTVTMGGPA
jgi:cyclic beta-1,2-glucan synthetase